MGHHKSSISPKRRGDPLPRSPLLLDACVAINLAATDHLPHIAQTAEVTFTLARQAAAEVGYLRDLTDGEVTLTPIDLGLYDGAALEITALIPAEYPLYVDLARTVDDGEAATIAVAVERGIPLATDDRKARRLCAELQLAEPMRTLGILHSYADAVRLQPAQLRNLLVKIRDRASFQPPRSDPDHKWWHEIVDNHLFASFAPRTAGPKDCLIRPLLKHAFRCPVSPNFRD
jgi:predicted nucleic acid-binding protein